MLNAWWCCTGEHASWDGHQPIICSLWDSPGVTFISPFPPSLCIGFFSCWFMWGNLQTCFCFKKQQTFPNCPLPRLRHWMYVNFQITWNGRFHSFDFLFGLSGWLWFFFVRQGSFVIHWMGGGQRWCIRIIVYFLGLSAVIVCYYVIYNNHSLFPKIYGFSENLNGFA